jgi:hypothetical protein
MSLSRSKRRHEVDERTADVLRRLPAAYTESSDEATRARHLVAIAEAARAAGEAVEQHPKRRNPVLRNRPMVLAARLGVSVIALCAVTAAVAGAGVTLPEPARGVADAVGLPNQAEENAADAGKDAEVRQDADVRQDDAADSKGKSDDAKSKADGDDVSAQQNDSGIGDDVSGLAEGLGERMRNAESDEERRQIADEFSDQVQTWAKDRSRLPEDAQDAPQEEQADTEAQGGPETGDEQSQNAPVDGQDVADEHRPETPADNRP